MIVFYVLLAIFIAGLLYGAVQTGHILNRAANDPLVVDRYYKMFVIKLYALCNSACILFLLYWLLS